MVRFREFGGALLAAALIASAPTAGSAAVETLKSVYAAILQQPDSVELNLRYAQIAEAEGKPRLALAAYERILLIHPDNAEAKAGLLRIKRLLTPERTSFETRFAIAFETNPRHASMPLPNGEANGWARIAMTDERRLGDTTMWRSYGLLYGALHAEASELNYGYASFVTGPLLDGAGFTIHPTIGGGVAAFQNQLYFAEALAAIAVEGEFNGAMQTMRLRGGYRDYNDFFPSDNGFFADLTGRFAFPNVAETRGTLVVAPWARWSGIEGTGFDINGVEVAPGRYVEVGGRIEHVQPIADRVALAANFEVNKRWYNVGTREDLKLAPGGAIILKNALAYANDVRLDYQYVDNNSTDPLHDYVDHIVTLQVINRY
jgi:hypothetical protein